MSMIEHTTPAAGTATSDAPTGRTSISSVQASLSGIGDSLTKAVSERVWSILHVLGAHHWSDGYDVDAERGMTRYRGTRCTICDNPWEGW